nr:HAD-IA family hydrolase [Nocardioides panzhihuensis]
MPTPVNARAADAAREVIGQLDLPPAIATTTDHLAVLRHVLEHHPEQVAEVEEACTRAEVAAARTCAPSVHATNLFELISRRRMPAAVVSNNSDQAVIAFLERHGWTRHVAVLSCRRPDDVGRLKPDPFLVQQALRSLRVDPGEALFLGDTTSDVRAGAAAGVGVLAFAKDEHLRSELTRAGAAAVTSLGDPRGLEA